MALTVPWIGNPKAVLYTDFGEIVYTPDLLVLYMSSAVKTQIFIPGTGRSTEDYCAFPASALNTPSMELSPGI